MSVVTLIVSAGAFALVLVGGSVIRRVFVAPEPIDNSRQYWS